MAGAKPHQLILAVLGLAVSGAFVVVAFRHLDFAALAATIRAIRVWPWLPLSIAAYVAGQLARGQRLRILVRRESTLSLTTASNVVVIGYASNNVFPARLGEFVRAGILAERTGIPLAQSLTVTLIERILDAMAILVLLIAGGGAGGARPAWLANVERVAPIALAGAALVLFAAVAMPRAVLIVTLRRSSRLGRRWRDRLIALATSVTSAGACLRRPRDAAVVGSYSLLVWVLESAMFALLLPAFSLPFASATAVVTMSVTNLGILVPSSPGYIGSFHYFCSRALEAQGVPATAALGYALMVHLAFFVPTTLWGGAAVWRYGVEVGATAALARAARSIHPAASLEGVAVRVIARLDGEPSPPAATAFHRALAQSVLSPGDDADPDAVAHAATFLAEEMAALPPRLGAMFQAGMAAFRLYVRLRYFRAFCALPAAARQRAVNSWAYGRIALLRQLFRPVRATVLLAYYERVHAPPALAIRANGRAPRRLETYV